MADRGRKAQPSANPYLTEKWKNQDQAAFEARIAKTTACVDTSEPLAWKLRHLRATSPKREYFEEVRHIEVQRENDRLVDEISKILRSEASRGTPSCQGGSTTSRPLHRTAFNIRPGYRLDANQVPHLDMHYPHMPSTLKGRAPKNRQQDIINDNVGLYCRLLERSHQDAPLTLRQHMQYLELLSLPASAPLAVQLRQYPGRTHPGKPGTAASAPSRLMSPDMHWPQAPMSPEPGPRHQVPAGASPHPSVQGPAPAAPRGAAAGPRPMPHPAAQSQWALPPLFGNTQMRASWPQERLPPSQRQTPLPQQQPAPPGDQQPPADACNACWPHTPGYMRSTAAIPAVPRARPSLHPRALQVPPPNSGLMDTYASLLARGDGGYDWDEAEEYGSDECHRGQQQQQQQPSSCVFRMPPRTAPQAFRRDQPLDPGDPRDPRIAEAARIAATLLEALQARMDRAEAGAASADHGREHSGAPEDEQWAGEGGVGHPGARAVTGASTAAASPDATGATDDAAAADAPWVGAPSPGDDDGGDGYESEQQSEDEDEYQPSRSSSTGSAGSYAAAAATAAVGTAGGAKLPAIVSISGSGSASSGSGSGSGSDSRPGSAASSRQSSNASSSSAGGSSAGGSSEPLSSSSRGSSRPASGASSRPLSMRSSSSAGSSVLGLPAVRAKQPAFTAAAVSQLDGDQEEEEEVVDDEVHDEEEVLDE